MKVEILREIIMDMYEDNYADKDKISHFEVYMPKNFWRRFKQSILKSEMVIVSNQEMLNDAVFSELYLPFIGKVSCFESDDSCCKIVLIKNV